MIARHSFRGILPATLLLLADSIQLASAGPYSIDGRDEILASARTLAFDLMGGFYSGNETGEIPGLLPQDDGYYWWQGAVLMTTMLDYAHYTGDEAYNDNIVQGILHQVGQLDAAFMPANQSASLANDDQCYWALSAMTAAENGFEDTPAGEPDWLTLAETVFGQLAERFDSEVGGACDGGLRWNIFQSNQGYEYKNSASNGCFLNLGARLARYTGNGTYAEYAEKVWDWLSDAGLLDTESWRVYDGAMADTNCSRPVPTQWSANAAFLTQGSAFMFNYTNGSDTWRERVDKLSEAMVANFFPSGTIYEVACERQRGLCPLDAQFFKGVALQRLASTTQLAPFTAGRIRPALTSSAQSAVHQCTGGADGRQCGFYWEAGEFVDPGQDATTGAGGQMSVLSAVLSLLAQEADAPLQASSPRPSGDDDSSDGGDGGDNNSGDSTDNNSGNGADGGSMASLAGVSSMGVLAALGCWVLLAL